MEIGFHKYHGTGNDFILVDDRGGLFPDGPAARQELIARLCARRTGIGADGLILIQEGSTPTSAFRMIYHNADGLEGSFCGNGSRCALAFAHEIGVTGDIDVIIEASDGLHRASILSHCGEGRYRVRVQLRDSAPARRVDEDSYFVDTGSPHLVIFGDKIKALDVPALGRKIRHSGRWQPGGVNVNFVQVKGESGLYIRTYERGVEAETLSCGTGAAAAALAAWFRAKPAEDGAAQGFSAQGSGEERAIHRTASAGEAGNRDPRRTRVSWSGEDGPDHGKGAAGAEKSDTARRFMAAEAGMLRPEYHIMAEGGELRLSFAAPSETPGMVRDIMLEGPAIKVFDGTFTLG